MLFTPQKAFFMVHAQARQNNGKATEQAKKFARFCPRSPLCTRRNRLYLMTSWMKELCVPSRPSVACPAARWQAFQPCRNLLTPAAARGARRDSE